MKVGLIPENVLERVALAANLAPRALGESWFTFALARTIMSATRLGVFEALAGGPRATPEVASSCGTDPRGTDKLLVALAGAGYVEFQDGKYNLSSHTRRWLLESSPGSARDKVLFQFVEWDWWGKAEEFVRTGQPLRMHENMDTGTWRLYQRGMRSGIEPFAREVSARLQLPRGARKMLDIGGSHGLYSVLFCKRHPALSAVILDLQEAVDHAAEILAKENMGDRVVHRVGNALSSDLGTEEYDLVFTSALVHHFDEAQNRSLAKSVARALRPGGVYAILDAIRVDPAAGNVSQIAGLLDLFFAMTSESGTWSAEEMSSWQRDAGLVPRRLMRLRLVRDIGVQAAVKPA